MYSILKKLFSHGNKSDNEHSDETVTQVTDLEENVSTQMKFLEEDVIDKTPAGFNLRRNGLSLKVNKENVVFPDVYVKINDASFKLDICFCYKTIFSNVGDWYTNCLTQKSNDRKSIQNSKRLMKCLKDNFSNIMDSHVICCMLYNVQNFQENNINAIANNTLLFIRMEEKLELYLYSFLDKENKVYSIPYSEGLTYYTNLEHRLGDKTKKLVNYTIEVKLDTATASELLRCPVCNYSNEYYGVGVTTASGNDIVAIGCFYDKIKNFIHINDNANSITLDNDTLETSNCDENKKRIIRKIVEDTNRHLVECKSHFVGKRNGYTNTKDEKKNVEFIKYALRYAYGEYDNQQKVYRPFKTFDQTLKSCIEIKEFLGLDLTISKDKTAETLEEKISKEINSHNLKNQFIDFINIRDNQNNQFEKSFHHICCSHCLYQLPIRLFERRIQNKYINCIIMLVGNPDSGKTVMLTKINYHCNSFIQNQGIDTYYKEKNETAIFETKTLPQSTNNDNILPTNYITTTLNGTNYTLILKDSVGENAKIILQRNYYIVYLVDITKSASEQFGDLISNLNSLGQVPDSRTYKIYVIFTKSDMLDYDFSDIKYNFQQDAYDFSHAKKVREIFLSDNLQYKPKDDDYYNVCCSHILKKIQQETGLNILEMNIHNVNMEAIEKNLEDGNETAKEYFNELKKIKYNYDNYEKIYDSGYLDELKSSILSFENSVSKRIEDGTGKSIIVSYNVISALEEYTPIWSDCLSDCSRLTQFRFNQDIRTDGYGNNIYENLIEDIKEVMVNCNESFSKKIFE